MARDCPNPAVLSPVIVIRALRSYNNNTPIAMGTNMQVCQSCADIVHLNDLLPDDAWRQIVAGFRARGQAEPDKSRTIIKWVTLAGAAAAQKKLADP